MPRALTEHLALISSLTLCITARFRAVLRRMLDLHDIHLETALYLICLWSNVIGAIMVILSQARFSCCIEMQLIMFRVRVHPDSKVHMYVYISDYDATETIGT